MDSKKKQSSLILETSKKKIVVEKAVMLNIRKGAGNPNSVATFKNQIIKLKICSSDFTGDNDFPLAVQELLSQMKNTKAPGETFTLTYLYKEDKPLESLTLKDAVVLYISLTAKESNDVFFAWIGFKEVEMNRSLESGNISVKTTTE